MDLARGWTMAQNQLRSCLIQTGVTHHLICCCAILFVLAGQLMICQLSSSA